MPVAVSKKHIAVSFFFRFILFRSKTILTQSELLQSLEDNDLNGFIAQLNNAKGAGADLNQQYGGESGFKTILHLALEEDDGLPYMEELLKVSTPVENPVLFSL